MFIEIIIIMRLQKYGTRTCHAKQWPTPPSVWIIRREHTSPFGVIVHTTHSEHCQCKFCVLRVTRRSLGDADKISAMVYFIRGNDTIFLIHFLLMLASWATASSPESTTSPLAPSLASDSKSLSR